MPRKKQEAPEISVDAATMVYKDRSGAVLGGGHVEGKVNFGAITAGALETVRLAQEAEAKAAPSE